jgi:hypothetical protein
MGDGKSKEGLSIKEIEAYAKRHRFEVFFGLIFILACLFTFAMWGAGWSIICATVGALIGIFFSARVEHFSKITFQFVFRHETGTQLVLAIVALILTIFIPPLYFLILGLHGGKSLRHFAIEEQNSNLKK